MRHVRGVAHGVDATTLGGLDRCRTVGVLEYHVDTLIDQRVGRVGFLARIEPGVDPHHFDFGAWVVLVQGQLNRVDIADYFRDREGGDVTDLLGFGHFRCEEAADITTFIGARQVGAEVLVLLVTGGVFEGDFGELLSHFQRWVHVAEGGGEDQIKAALGHVADHAFGVCAFWHVLHIAGFDFIAEFLDQLLATLLVLVGPAVVANRADIDETNLQRIGGGRAQGGAETKGGDEGAQQGFFALVLHGRWNSDVYGCVVVKQLTDGLQKADQLDN